VLKRKISTIVLFVQSICRNKFVFTERSLKFANDLPLMERAIRKY